MFVLIILVAFALISGDVVIDNVAVDYLRSCALLMNLLDGLNHPRMSYNCRAMEQSEAGFVLPCKSGLRFSDAFVRDVGTGDHVR